jgi:hypothetical protein
MSSVLDVVKKQIILVLLVLVVGVAIGVPLGWATVRVVNTTPAVMREDLQEDYLRMAIDSFRVNRDPNLAVRRWDALGPAAATMFVKIQKDPAGIDPVVVVAFGEVIQAVKGPTAAEAEPQSGPANTPASGGALTPSKSNLLVSAVVILVVVAAATALFLVRRMVRRRSAGQITPAAEEPQYQREPVRARKTNFESLGVAPPITQNMTTYVLGDDLYDESFSIDTASGDFLGEYGVGVSETIGIGEPKKVTALEIWLFDKNDIKTATKVLMSTHAFGDAGSWVDWSARTDEVGPQKQIMLETETLQLLATVIDLQYVTGDAGTKLL